MGVWRDTGLYLASEEFLKGIWRENPVLVAALGLCPALAVTNTLMNGVMMSLATTFVLTLSSVCSYLVNEYVLAPLGLEYLRTISFILVIAAVVQFTEMVVHKTSPLLYQVLGIFLPLITTNCAILGGSLFMVERSYDFAQSVVFGFGSGLGCFFQRFFDAQLDFFFLVLFGLRQCFAEFGVGFGLRPSGVDRQVHESTGGTGGQRQDGDETEEHRKQPAHGDHGFTSLKGWGERDMVGTVAQC